MISLEPVHQLCMAERATAGTPQRAMSREMLAAIEKGNDGKESGAEVRKAKS